MDATESILIGLLWLVALFVIAPALVYTLVKFAVAGYYRAVSLHNRNKQRTDNESSTE